MMSQTDDSENNAHFGATDDHPSSVDQLGFETYVDAVRYFLTHEETEAPLTLSIEGEWGSGKSSFMNQLQTSLEEEGNLTVEFNPWKHEKQEALWAAFALTFINQIRSTIPLRNRPKKHLSLAWKRMSFSNGIYSIFKPLILLLVVSSSTTFLLYDGHDLVNIILNRSPMADADLRFWLGTSGVIVSILASIDLARRFYNLLGDTLNKTLHDQTNSPSYKEKTNFLEDFQSDFEMILDTYVNGDEKVYVFIDDLDRCTVPKAADLMQSINLMVSNDSRLIFILGLDRQRVAAGIAAKHETMLEHMNNTNNSLDFGYRYLEKFIQIPFLVPKPKDDGIQKLVREEIIEGEDKTNDRETIDIQDIWTNDLAEEFENSLDSVVKMATPVLGNNPRRVKRFINLYRLRAVLTRSEGLLVTYGEDLSEETITLPQLAKFVIISIQWPEFVSRMYNDPTIIEELLEFSEEEGESIDDFESLQPWASDEELMNLITYGERERYSLRDVSITNLRKISPRTDRPMASEDLSPRRVKIAFFRGALDVELEQVSEIVDSITDGINVEADVLVFDIEDGKVKSPNSEDPLYCYIWVGNPNLLINSRFQKLYQKAPAESTLISIDSETELVGLPSGIDPISVGSAQQLEEALYHQLSMIDPSSEESSQTWEKWRKEVVEIDSSVHGIIEAP